MKNIVIGNWKMNPASLEEALELGSKLDLEGAILCPPFLYLEPISEILKKAKLGAQDLSFEESGAHTGEISAKQLKDLGITYVLLGHSERRALGESNELVQKKLKSAVSSELIPVLCIGESLETKERSKTKEFLKNQISSALEGLQLNSILIAYEPIWAIGSANPAEPESVDGNAEFIKEESQSHGTKASVLYGGSTDGSNISDYLSLKNISGVLVGGSSLKAEEFRRMLEIANSQL